MKRLLLILVAATATYAFAFRPSLQGTTSFWFALAVPYLLLAGLSLHKMWQDGDLERLKPRWGDVGIGVSVGGLLLLASWAGRAMLAPAGTPRQGWIFRIYLQLGQSEEIERSILVSAILLLVPVCEELVWRGAVLHTLSRRLGMRAAWPITALLYAAAMIPTAFGLYHEEAGLNPLLFLAGLGCGLVWSFMAGRLGRLPPVILSHMTFTYFSVVQFRSPGM
jgi:hypothetical protein